MYEFTEDMKPVGEHAESAIKGAMDWLEQHNPEALAFEPIDGIYQHQSASNQAARDLTRFVRGSLGDYDSRGAFNDVITAVLCIREQGWDAYRESRIAAAQGQAPEPVAAAAGDGAVAEGTVADADTQGSNDDG